MTKMPLTWRRGRTSPLWLVYIFVLLLRFSLIALADNPPGIAPSNSSSTLPSVLQSNQEYDCKKLGVTSTLFVISEVNLSLINTTFANCPAGVLYFNGSTSTNSTSSTTVTLTNCTFINNTASRTNSTLTLSSTSTFTSATYGAALIITGSVTITLTNCNFTGNSAALAPAIYSSAGSTLSGGLTLRNCSFTDNIGHGTVTIEKGTLSEVSDCTFTGNSGGSALYITRLMITSADQNLKMTRLSFQRNVANASGLSYAGDSDVGSTGAAVYISSVPADITINSSTFRQNKASTQGGAVAVRSGERPLTLYDCTVEYNQAELYGGAVYLTSAAELVAEGSTFVNNTAKQGGAIAVTMISVLSTKTCNFTNNSAGQFGGAISGTTAATMSVYNTTFKGNYAKFAGALECWSCEGLTAIGNTFTSNYATGSAGALALIDGMSHITMSNNVFEGNWVPSNKSSISKTCSRDSNGAGGAACVALQTGISLSNNTFRSNSATSGGALFVSRQCDVQVDTDTCLAATLSIDYTNKMIDNAAVGGAGGAVYALNVTALTVSCTSTTNSSQHDEWVGEDIPSWSYGSEGCTNNWIGNQATMGGYGHGLATGLLGLRLAGTNGTNSTDATVANVNSGYDIALSLELYDAFGSMMSQGSYEVGTTTVTVDIITNPILSDYLSGTSTSTTSGGLAEFNSLQVQAPPGSYNLTFLPLPAGTTQTEAHVYKWITIIVQIRECLLGETTATSGDECNLCSGTSYYSLSPANSSCDWCPANAMCLHAITTTTTTTTTSSTNSSSSSSSSGRRRLMTTTVVVEEYDYTSDWDYSEELSSSTTISNKGYLLPADGYWHSSPFSPQMLECPVTAACSATNRTRRIGRWQESRLGLKDTYLPTPNDSVIWNISVYWNLQCATAYMGPLCAICAEGYGWRASGSCYQCPSRGLNTIFYVLSYGLTAALLIVTIRSTLVRTVGEERAAVRAARNAGSLRRRYSEEEEEAEEGEGEEEGKGMKEPWKTGLGVSGGRGLEDSAQASSVSGSNRTAKRGVAEAASAAMMTSTPFGGGGGSRRGSTNGSRKGNGSWKGRVSVGGGAAASRSSNLLEQAAMAAMAQLEAEAASGSSSESDEDDERTSGGSGGRTSIRQVYSAGRGGMVVREPSGAILPPAALPGAQRVGSGRRVPRSVRARESALAAVVTPDSGDCDCGGGGPVAVASGGTTGDRAVAAATAESAEGLSSRRHRLSRMSRPTGAGSSVTADRGGGGGPVAEGLLMTSASSVRDGGDSTTGWLPGMRRRRPGDIDGGGDDGESGAVQGRADVSRNGVGVAEAYTGNTAAGTDSWRTQPTASSLPSKQSESETETLATRGDEREQGEEDEHSLMEDKPPHAVVIKILVNYLQVTTVVRSLNLQYPSTLERLFNIGSMASSAVSTFVSLDCSLPSGFLSKAIQRTLITVTLPGIFSILAVPIWCIIYALQRRAARRAVPLNRTASASEVMAAPSPLGSPGGDGGLRGAAAESGSRKGGIDEEEGSGSGAAGGATATTHVVPYKSPTSADYGGVKLYGGGLSGKGEGLAVAESMGAVNDRGEKSIRVDNPGGGAGGGGGAGDDGGEAWESAMPEAADTPLSLYLTRRMLVTTIATVFYFYPAVTDAVLSIFSCEQADVDTDEYNQYLRAIGYFWQLDYRLRCFHGQHLVMAAAIAFPGIVFWAVGVPAGSAVWLWRGFKRGLLSDPEFSCRYGFLYEDYRRRYYYWESVIMARKLLVVGLLLATSNQTDIVQVLTVLGVVILATVAQVLCRPFATPRFNNLEATSLTATTVILYLCAFFLIPDLTTSARQALSMLILVVNVGMLAWFIHCLVRETWRYGIKVLDTDGDGHVSRQEIQEWLQLKLGAPLGRLVAWMAGKGGKKKAASSKQQQQMASSRWNWGWGRKQERGEEVDGLQKGGEAPVVVGGGDGGAVTVFVTSPKPAVPVTVVLTPVGPADGGTALSTPFSPPFSPPLPPPPPPRPLQLAPSPKGGSMTSQEVGVLGALFPPRAGSAGGGGGGGGGSGGGGAMPVIAAEDGRGSDSKGVIAVLQQSAGSTAATAAASSPTPAAAASSSTANDVELLADRNSWKEASAALEDDDEEEGSRKADYRPDVVAGGLTVSETVRSGGGRGSGSGGSRRGGNGEGEGEGGEAEGGLRSVAVLGSPR